MTALATRIAEDLANLAPEAREQTLAEVRERLQDIRAREVYESYLKGKDKTLDFEETLGGLEKRYGV